MPTHNLVVIGGSAGSLGPLRIIVERLPPDYPGTVLVTIHSSPHSPGQLPALLQPAARVPVFYALDGQPLQPGEVLLAPPDRHLLVQDGVVRLSRGPRENRSRPAIDPMFRSAAENYRERVIGILLSGLLDDGSDGMIAIKRRGGRAIVQDPFEAEFPAMPQSALSYAEVDEVLRAPAIAGRLLALAHVAPEPVAPSAEVVPNGDDFGRGGFETGGVPSSFACPDCHGALWELHEGSLVRFRCRTGHAYSADNAAAALDEDVERAVWAALRALEEKAALSRKLIAASQGRAMPVLVDMYERRLAESEEHAHTLRRMLGAEKARIGIPGAPGEGPEPAAASVRERTEEPD